MEADQTVILVAHLTLTYAITTVNFTGIPREMGILVFNCIMMIVFGKLLRDMHYLVSACISSY